MSGGSYDYLYAKYDLLGQRDNLILMAHRLRELGADDAAEATDALRKQQEAIEAESDFGSPLRELWHDVEWLDSGDYGMDQVTEGIKQYRSQKVPDLTPGEMTE